MNKLPKWKISLIKWLAGKEPVLLNYVVFGSGLPKDKTAVIILPNPSEIRPQAYYENKCFLVPSKNVEAKP